MKTIKEIEKDRLRSFKQPSFKSVHRSSLLVPKIDNFKTQISFLNHFIIKRNNPNTCIKITAYNFKGNFLSSIDEELNVKKVYNYNLDELFVKKIKEISSYQVEFFSSKNLFIPFPAVIVEHVSKLSRNIVHSYNRILNDTFEDKSINSLKVDEASFEIYNNKNFSTGFLFHAGQYEVNSNIKININKNKYKVPIKCKPFNQKFFSLGKYLKKEKIAERASLSIPQQHMFYGRVLVGSFDNRINKRYFTANHSFYDSSKTKEYFSNNNSKRLYPFFKGKINILNFYPINSRSTIKIYIKASNGVELLAGKIISPGKKNLSINLSKLFTKHKIICETYEIIAKVDKKIPTRVNHQIIFKEKENTIPCSINVSLFNESINVIKRETNYIWGPVLSSKNYKSISRILGKTSKSKVKGKLKLWSDEGLFFEKFLDLKENEFFDLDAEILSKKKSPFEELCWYSFESDKNCAQSFSLHTNKKSLVSAGEHNF